MAFAYKVPNWLKNIKKGEYTITDFIRMTNQGYSNINERLKALGVEFHRKKAGNSNYVVKTYIWLGSEYYEKQSLILNPRKGE